MKKYMTLLLIGLLASCSSTDTPQPPADEWLPVVSRTEGSTDTKEYLVTLKYGNTSSEGTLVAGASSSWKDNHNPVWPNDDTSVDVFALHPALTTMPTELGDDKVYTMHHSKADKNDKPGSFTMNHLMAQLKVHILIHEEQVHTPHDGVINLRRKGTIRYGGEKSPYLDASSHASQPVSLGTFKKVSSDDGTAVQSSEWHDDDFENEPMTVVPQTFKAGEDCVTFQVEDVVYVFKPQKDITLEVGKINILWLGITYSEPEMDDNGNSSGSGTGGAIPVVELEGITVTPWVSGETINGGEAQEQ